MGVHVAGVGSFLSSVGDQAAAYSFSVWARGTNEQMSTIAPVFFNGRIGT